MLLLPIFAVCTKPSVDCPVVVTVLTVRGPLSPVLSLGTWSLGYSVIRSISRVVTGHQEGFMQERRTCV